MSYRYERNDFLQHDHVVDPPRPAPGRSNSSRLPPVQRQAKPMSHRAAPSRYSDAELQHASAAALLGRDTPPVQRKADVQETAASGVAGSGAPLPHLTAIQTSFGHHDVTGVRAHVGGAAAEAAAAIGASAYATGNDVAFGASPDLHLAAHEAAHVVQQRGGVRCSGGVGQVGDAYEQHADAVADRVGRGESAESLLDQMAHRGASGGSAVQRTIADNMADNADLAENRQLEEMAAHPPATTPTTVGDLAQARTKRNVIVDAMPELRRGADDSTPGTATPENVAANEHAIGLLDRYLGAAGSQESSLSQFQANFERLGADYARLHAQIETLDVSRGDGNIMSAQTGEVAGDRIIESAGQGAGAADMNSRFRDAAQANTGSGATSDAVGRSSASRERMNQASGEVAATQSALAPAESTVRSSVDNLLALTSRQQGDQVESQIAGLRAHAQAAKDAVGMLGQVIGLATRAGIQGDVSSAVGANIASVATSLAQHAASRRFDNEIRQLSGQLRAIREREAVAEMSAAIETVTAAKGAYITAAQAYVNAVTALRRNQSQHREDMSAMGQSADRATGGDGEFAQIAQILSECDAYLAQSSATQRIGFNEESTAGAASDRAAEVNDGAGVVWYRPNRIYTQQSFHIGAVEQRFQIVRGGASQSAEGPNGANETVRHMLETLQTNRATIEQMAGRLRAIFRQSGNGPQ